MNLIGDQGNEYLIAFDQFCLTFEALKAVELGMTRAMLWRAFVAGIEAGQRIQSEAMMQRLKNLFEEAT